MKSTTFTWLTLKQAAPRLGVTPERVRHLILANRIPGAHKVGDLWLIPSNFTVLRRRSNRGPKARWEEKKFVVSEN